MDDHTKNYAGLKFVSRNLLDTAAGGTFMEITLVKPLNCEIKLWRIIHNGIPKEHLLVKKLFRLKKLVLLSEKIDPLMKLVASKNAPIYLNDVPLSTLIEKNNDPIDVNFVSRNKFNSNAYRGNFNHRPFLGNSLTIMAIPMVIILTIIIGTPLILRVILKNLSMLKKFSTL